MTNTHDFNQISVIVQGTGGKQPKAAEKLTTKVKYKTKKRVSKVKKCFRNIFVLNV